MAAKSLKEVVERLDVKGRFARVVCVGKLDELTNRIDEAALRLEQDIINELRDFFAHEVMKMEGKYIVTGVGDVPTAGDLFDKVFKDVPATGGRK